MPVPMRSSRSGGTALSTLSTIRAVPPSVTRLTWAPAMLTPAAPSSTPTVPTTPGRSAYTRNTRWGVGAMSTSKPSTSVSRSACRGPLSVPGDGDRRAVGQHAVDARAASGGRGSPRRSCSCTSTPALGGQRRGVDEGHLVLHDVGEHALERRQLQHRRRRRPPARRAPRRRRGRRPRRRAPVKTRPSFSTSGSARPDLLHDDAARLHVDRVGHELARERQADRARDRDAGLVLRLDRGRTEVRSDDDRREGEQRRRRRRLGLEDVEPGAGHGARGQRLGQRRLVDQAAPRRVDDPHRRLAQRELLGADQPHRLRASSAGGC